jgi:hypothetical protein
MDLLIIALGICGGVKSVHYIYSNIRKIKDEARTDRPDDANK